MKLAAFARLHQLSYVAPRSVGAEVFVFLLCLLHGMRGSITRDSNASMSYLTLQLLQPSPHVSAMMGAPAAMPGRPAPPPCMACCSTCTHLVSACLQLLPERLGGCLSFLCLVMCLCCSLLCCSTLGLGLSCLSHSTAEHIRAGVVPADANCRLQEQCLSKHLHLRATPQAHKL